MKRLQSPIAKKVNLICFLKKYKSSKNDSTKQTQLQIQKCFNNTVTILNKNKKIYSPCQQYWFNSECCINLLSANHQNGENST